MSTNSDLEIKGSFLAHPFAELVAEIAHARLNGSLRVTNKEKKAVVYFKRGRVVFAVSNARSSRLFDILLSRGKLKKEDLAHFPDFANDLALSAFLKDNGFLTKDECDRLFETQIEGILVDLLTWTEGDWTFSSLARIRDGLEFQVDATALLIEFGRCISVDRMLSRFRSLGETFSRSGADEIGVSLSTEEAFVLSRADEGELTASNLVNVSAMSEATALQTIYTLWLGGLLVRNDWQPAFSYDAVRSMKTAKLELKQEARIPGQAAYVPQAEAPPVPAPASPEAPEPEPASVITLEEYLDRVEQAQTHYDVLGIPAKADLDEIKRAYFGLAKMFHPDRYHAVGGETLQRVQKAFTELAQAHETLKTEESRELYDYRMRKEIADREKREAAGDAGAAGLRLQQAEEHFERGLNLLMDQEHESALPFLARAVHFAPQNARYHAYYGKALAADAKQRYKAEAELQAALKIDPNNPGYRIMLAEFFLQHNLKKRAEGELTRLLAIFPSNREAREMLDRLKATT